MASKSSSSNSRFPSLPRVFKFKESKPPPAPPPKDPYQQPNKSLLSLATSPDSPGVTSPSLSTYTSNGTPSLASQSTISLVSTSEPAKQNALKTRKSGFFKFGSRSRTNLNAPSSPQNDDNISLPWNFQHNLHVDEGMQGLPPSWTASLAQAGYSEDEIASIRSRRMASRTQLQSLSRAQSPANSTFSFVSNPNPRSSSLHRQDQSVSTISTVTVSDMPPPGPLVPRKSSTSTTDSQRPRPPFVSSPFSSGSDSRPSAPPSIRSFSGSSLASRPRTPPQQAVPTLAPAPAPRRQLYIANDPNDTLAPSSPPPAYRAPPSPVAASFPRGKDAPPPVASASTTPVESTTSRLPPSVQMDIAGADNNDENDNDDDDDIRDSRRFTLLPSIGVVGPLAMSTPRRNGDAGADDDDDDHDDIFGHYRHDDDEFDSGPRSTQPRPPPQTSKSLFSSTNSSSNHHSPHSLLDTSSFANSSSPSLLYSSQPSSGPPPQSVSPSKSKSDLDTTVTTFSHAIVTSPSSPLFPSPSKPRAETSQMDQEWGHRNGESEHGREHEWHHEVEEDDDEPSSSLADPSRRFTLLPPKLSLRLSLDQDREGISSWSEALLSSLPSVKSDDAGGSGGGLGLGLGLGSSSKNETPISPSFGLGMPSGSPSAKGSLSRSATIASTSAKSFSEHERRRSAKQKSPARAAAVAGATAPPVPQQLAALAPAVDLILPPPTTPLWNEVLSLVEQTSSSSLAAATSLSSMDSKDNYIKQEQPTNNIQPSFLVTADDNEGEEGQVLIVPPISSSPSSSALTGATLSPSMSVRNRTASTPTLQNKQNSLNGSPARKRLPTFSTPSPSSPSAPAMDGTPTTSEEGDYDLSHDTSRDSSMSNVSMSSVSTVTVHGGARIIGASVATRAVANMVVRTAPGSGDGTGASSPPPNAGAATTAVPVTTVPQVIVAPTKAAPAPAIAPVSTTTTTTTAATTTSASAPTTTPAPKTTVTAAPPPTSTATTTTTIITKPASGAASAADRAAAALAADRTAAAHKAAALAAPPSSRTMMSRSPGLVNKVFTSSSALAAAAGASSSSSGSSSRSSSRGRSTEDSHSGHGHGRGGSTSTNGLRGMGRHAYDHTPASEQGELEVELPMSATHLKPIITTGSSPLSPGLAYLHSRGSSTSSSASSLQEPPPVPEKPAVTLLPRTPALSPVSPSTPAAPRPEAQPQALSAIQPPKKQASERYQGWQSKVLAPLEEFIDYTVDPRDLYYDLREIAEGESGSVYAAGIAGSSAEEESTNASDSAAATPTIVAIKSIAFTPTGAPEQKLNDLKHELTLLRSLPRKHENVLSMDALYLDLTDDALWIRMELMERSLADVIGAVADGLVIPERMIARVASDVLCGLEYLHENKVAHRDIRSDNLLLNVQGVLKIADFSSAASVTTVPPLSTDVVGVIYWQAPEVRTGSYDPFKVDIWSLGATVWETAEAEPPFSNVTDVRQITNSYPPLTRPEVYSRSFTEFLRLCGLPATKRPSLSTLRHTPLIQNACGRHVVVQLLSQCRTIEERLATAADDE